MESLSRKRLTNVFLVTETDPQFQAIVAVHSEHFDRRSAYGGQTEDDSLCDFVLRPILLPRMKQRHQRTGLGIMPAEIRALEAIAL